MRMTFPGQRSTECSLGYLSVYDLAMLQMLYDRRIRAGMGRAEVETLLPQIIRDLK